MTIYERALEMVPSGATLGLGSGRAAWAFVKLLGERIQQGGIKVRGVAASEETAKLANTAGVPLLSLDEAGELDLTVDGADEVDPQCNLIKGWGRALVREKVLATMSKRLRRSNAVPSPRAAAGDRGDRSAPARHHPECPGPGRVARSRSKHSALNGLGPASGAKPKRPPRRSIVG